MVNTTEVFVVHRTPLNLSNFGCSYVNGQNCGLGVATDLVPPGCQRGTVECGSRGSAAGSCPASHCGRGRVQVLFQFPVGFDV